MNRIGSVVILLIALSIILPLAGCHKQAAPASDSRHTRLTADENLRLKDQMQKLETQIDKLTKDLAQCNEENKKVKKEAEDNVNFAMTTVLDECKKEAPQIRDENEKLKAQIKQLQDELKQSKSPSH